MLKPCCLNFWVITTNEPPNDKTNKMAYGPSEDSDQPGMPGLIRVFAGRTVILLVLSWGGGLDFLGFQFLGILHYLSSRPSSFSQKKLIFSM